MAKIRPIDANALSTNDLPAYYGGNVREEDVQAWIDEAPTLECEPVRHSQWQLRSFASRKLTVDGSVICPECGQSFFLIVGTWFKRCPECGAKMDGGKED